MLETEDNNYISHLCATLWLLNLAFNLLRDFDIAHTRGSTRGQASSSAESRFGQNASISLRCETSAVKDARGLSVHSPSSRPLLEKKWTLFLLSLLGTSGIVLDVRELWWVVMSHCEGPSHWCHHTVTSTCFWSCEFCLNSGFALTSISRQTNVPAICLGCARLYLRLLVDTEVEAREHCLSSETQVLECFCISFPLKSTMNLVL